MCRLFGLTAGRVPVAATFWLLEAPDSLDLQSRANPDGTGLGTFDAAGRPRVEKAPLAAYEDRDFARQARRRRSTTFVAHVRRSSGTPLTPANTHPFEMDGRLCAHNGEIGGLDRLEAHLGPDLARVQGDTDSERMFALIAREAEAAGGDVSAGITTAMAWMAENVPVRSANLVITTAHELWALRWPAHHGLWILERPGSADTADGRVGAGATAGAGQAVEHRSGLGTRIRSEELAAAPSVAVASERLDGEPGWEPLEPGELVHVDPELAVHRTRILSASGE